MKKSFALSVLFLIIISVNSAIAQDYNDPTPQTSLTIIDITSAYKLWCSINRSISEIPQDSSQTNLEKEVVVFNGVKMMLSKNDGRFVAVSKWEIVNKQFIIIFSPDNFNKIERNVLSFSKLGSYKEIEFILLVGEQKFNLPLYTAHNPKTKDLKRITLKI